MLVLFFIIIEKKIFFLLVLPRTISFHQKNCVIVIISDREVFTIVSNAEQWKKCYHQHNKLNKSFERKKRIIFIKIFNEGSLILKARLHEYRSELKAV